MKLPDMTRDFVLKTDACDRGLGAVLFQEYNGSLFPVAYSSSKLSKAEVNYSVYEKECMAIIFGITKFQRFCMSRSLFLKQITNRLHIWPKRN